MAAQIVLSPERQGRNVVIPSVIESDVEEENAENPSVSTASDVNDRDDAALDHERNGHRLGINSLLEAAGQIFELLLSGTLMLVNILSPVIIGIMSCTALQTFIAKIAKNKMMYTLNKYSYVKSFVVYCLKYARKWLDGMHVQNKYGR